jgi:hypothetical protein
MARKTKKKVQTPNSSYMLEVNEASVDTCLNSYCQANGTTQDQLDMRELHWLCYVMTVYSNIPTNKENPC